MIVPEANLPSAGLHDVCFPHLFFKVMYGYYDLNRRLMAGRLRFK